jgi:hypothetical protein
MTAATLHRVLVVAAAVTTLSLVALTPNAHATALAPAVEQNFDEVYKWLERGGNPSPRTPLPCGTVCDDLFMAEHRPMPGQPASADMWKSLRTETQAVRKVSKLAPAWNILGKASLAASAAAVGWEVGTALRPIFYDTEAPALPSGTYKYEGIAPVERGGEIGRHTMPTRATQILIAPADGFVGTFAGENRGSAWYAPQSGSQAYNREPLPTGMTWFRTGVVQDQGPDYPYDQYEMRYAWRSGGMNAPRTTAKPGVNYAPRVEWPGTGEGVGGESAAQTQSRAKSELENNATAYPTLRQWLDSQLGGASADPTSTNATVPSCTGDLYAACAAKLEAAGFTPSRATLSFSTADVEQPADAVVTLSPAGGSSVQSGSTVTVTTNPGPDTMPKVVPAIEQGQTYDQYLAALQARGLVGQSVILTDATLDPSKGPSVVVSTLPATGTRVGNGTTVRVRVNPDTAPAAPGGGPGGGPTIHKLDLSPLNVGSLCDNFPFGVPCWLAEVVQSWVVEPGAPPSWQIPFPFVSEANEPSIDLTDWQPWAILLRALILTVATVGLALRFFSLATGQSRGGDGD